MSFEDIVRVEYIKELDTGHSLASGVDGVEGGNMEAIDSTMASKVIRHPGKRLGQIRKIGSN